MKKTIYGFLFLSLIGVISCEKEPLKQNTEATTEHQQRLEKNNTKNYALGADPLTLQLLRKQYTITSTPPVFGSGPSLNNLLYYGVGAYNYDMAVLGLTGTNFSDLTYESGIPGNNKYGLVKLNGADFLLDEVELIDDDINKIFGLRGGRIYKLTYNTSTTNFDATQIYAYPTAPKDFARRFTIAPVANNNSFIRLYSAKSVGSQPGQPQAMTTLNYTDIDTTTGTPSPSLNVTTLIPGMGDLSSFTAIDYFNTPPIAPKYYVVVNKDIYIVNPPVPTIPPIITLEQKSSFDNPVNDCSFYHRL